MTEFGATAVRARAPAGRNWMGRNWMGEAFLVLSALVMAVNLALPARAATQQDYSNFLKVTGFDVSIDSIQMTGENGPAMLGMQDKDFQTTWKVLTKGVFEPASMRKDAVDMLEKSLSDADLKEAVDFYGSDLGQRLVAAENASHMDDDADTPEKAKALLDKIMADGDNSRIEVLDRLNRAASAAIGDDDGMVQVQYRFLTAARDAGVINIQVDDQTLLDSLKKQSEDLSDASRQSALANAAYTYRDFSQKDLEAYADALESDSMQRVYKLMNKIQFRIIGDRFVMAAKRLKGVQPSTDL